MTIFTLLNDYFHMTKGPCANSLFDFRAFILIGPFMFEIVFFIYFPIYLKLCSHTWKWILRHFCLYIFVEIVGNFVFFVIICFLYEVGNFQNHRWLYDQLFWFIRENIDNWQCKPKQSVDPWCFNFNMNFENLEKNCENSQKTGKKLLFGYKE